jgi:outer membrane protein TolC
LSRFRNRRAAVATLARSEASASQSVQLNTQRYQAGTITLVNYLDVQRRHLAAQQQLSTAKANLTNDFVAIQKAMGFGWEQPANP